MKMKNSFLRSTTLACIILAIGFLFTLTNCTQEDDLALSPESYSKDANLSNNLGYSDGYFAGNPNFTEEGYNSFEENPFVNTFDEPVSTFSIDADGASYSNVRRFLSYNQLPPRDAIRTEEFINYFNYDYPEPTDGHPISLNGEISDCPWTSGNKLVRIGLKGETIPKQALPATNFVFLIDVSGSMRAENKLDLLKESFVMFTDYLSEEDRVAIVTYSGQAGVVLPSTSGTDKNTIKEAINSLGAGGSTAGAQGIITAYEIAQANFIKGGNNRVILGSDGDFNVGISSQDELVELIEEKRESGIFLTILGVGTGNLQDGKMEQIANNGNGTYEYIDNLAQAKKIFVHEFGKFYTVAKDVKIQIKFDPSFIKAYRLIGYENRLLNEEDFEDDEKDAGEIGSGQTITALYELIPEPLPLKSGPSIFVDFRYKKPDEDTSQPLFLDIADELKSFQGASENTRFAATVAGYGMLLRDSPYKGELSWDDLIQWTEGAKTFDPFAYRTEFLQLVHKAKNL